MSDRLAFGVDDIDRGIVALVVTREEAVNVYRCLGEWLYGDAQEAVARAIYKTHWSLPEESKRGLDARIPPTWEGASQAVREWVLKQAAAAIEAYEARA